MTALPLARCSELGQKNQKYPSTCYATPPQVGHRVTVVYPPLSFLDSFYILYSVQRELTHSLDENW